MNTCFVKPLLFTTRAQNRAPVFEVAQMTRLFFPILFLSLMSAVALAQDMNTLKSSVVRVRNTYNQDGGTGFIIKIEGERAYIITASHVVKNNEHPSVYLYNKQNEPVQATLTYREDDEQRGLALLEIKAKKGTFAGLVPVTLRSSSDLKGGEPIQVIGFPDGVTIWTVSSGSVARLEARNLIFNAPIRTGNSGSPVFFNGLVVGLVTDIDPNYVYSVRTEGLVDYLVGVNSKLAETIKPQPAMEKPTNRDNSEFCRALTRIVDSSHEGFYDIVKQGYDSTVVIPGFKSGMVSPQTQSASFSNFTSDRSKALSQYYELIANSKRCLSDWKQIDPSSWGRLRIQAIDAPMRFIFMRRDETTVSIENHTVGDSYMTKIEVYGANSHASLFLGTNNAKLALAFTDNDVDRDSACQDFKTLVQASHEGFSSIVGKPGLISGYFEASIKIAGFPSINVKRREEAYMIFAAEDLNEVEALNDRFVGLLTKCLPSWTATEVEPRSIYEQSTRRFRLIENTDLGSAFELTYDSNYQGAHSLQLYLYTPESVRKLR